MPGPDGRRYFTDDEIRAIRADLRQHVEVARDYHVSPSTIGHIRRRLIYIDVVDPLPVHDGR